MYINENILYIYIYIWRGPICENTFYRSQQKTPCQHHPNNQSLGNLLGDVFQKKSFKLSQRRHDLLWTRGEVCGVNISPRNDGGEVRFHNHGPINHRTYLRYQGEYQESLEDSITTTVILRFLQFFSSCRLV